MVEPQDRMKSVAEVFPNQPRPVLFLFDIDGTLLRGMPPTHRQAVCDAALQVFGVSITPAELGLTAGMTDSSIICRALRMRGIGDSAIQSGLPSFFAAAAEAYERHVPSDLRPFHTPYAEPSLQRLAEAGAYLALVTGNIQRIAWTKLRAAGLADYFMTGGFGDEAAPREQLPPLAMMRIAKLCGRTFLPRQVVVVGDTPLDIACGKACDLCTVAVATGPIHSRAELQAAGADYVFDDLGGLATLDVSSLWGTRGEA
jgi:phosphoglycolate phosphatase-like HAD superfamily hydrolase